MICSFQLPGRIGNGNVCDARLFLHKMHVHAQVLYTAQP